MSEKARAIIAKNKVYLQTSSTPRNLHFKVEQRSGVMCDVYRTTDVHGVTSWSCNAVSEEKSLHKKDAYGCVFRTVTSEEPLCSHELACSLWLKGAAL